MRKSRAARDCGFAASAESRVVGCRSDDGGCVQATLKPVARNQPTLRLDVITDLLRSAFTPLLSKTCPPSAVPAVGLGRRLGEGGTVGRAARPRCVIHHHGVKLGRCSITFVAGLRAHFPMSHRLRPPLRRLMIFPLSCGNLAWIGGESRRFSCDIATNFYRPVGSPLVRPAK